MKKFSTVILLFVFLMYQAGFYAFYLTLEHHNEEEWQGSLHLNNLKGNILEKSIPITFAYQPDQSDFQSVMQGIEINGQFYQVIMQRYAQDTLHVFYVVDNNKQNLHTSLKDWVNTISQQTNQSKKSAIKDGLEKNYIPNEINIVLINSCISHSIYNDSYLADLLQRPLETLKPPPKFTSRGPIA